MLRSIRAIANDMQRFAIRREVQPIDAIRRTHAMDHATLFDTAHHAARDR
jgi:hypothetical protein